jgi:hypothetical protein
MASQQQQTRTQRQQAKENQIIEQRSGKARARLFGKGAAAFLLSRVETRYPRPQKAPPLRYPDLVRVESRKSKNEEPHVSKNDF